MTMPSNAPAPKERFGPGWTLSDEFRYVVSGQAQKDADAYLARLEDENERLREQVANLRRQVTIKDQACREKNEMLDALHMVWCSGSCYGGVHRYEDRPVTEELVALAERNTARLRKWFNGVRWRQESGNWPTTSEYHRQYLERMETKVPRS